MGRPGGDRDAILYPARVTGERIGDRYELSERLGSGGTASVWRARDVADGRAVAVKLLHLDRAESAEAVARFEREARLLEAVRSEHVVRLLSHGDHKGRPYMVFALVDGEDLRERLRREGPLPPVEATRIALAMATGLEDAHARRVVHRDLKPANVLLDGRGAVRIADFGIARMLEEPGLTQPGRVLGTGEYVSPEQALGRKVDGRSDIYALGVVLFEMLTGRPPFTGPGFADVAAQHVRAPVPLRRRRRPGDPGLAGLAGHALPAEAPRGAPGERAPGAHGAGGHPRVAGGRGVRDRRARRRPARGRRQPVGGRARSRRRPLADELPSRRPRRRGRRPRRLADRSVPRCRRSRAPPEPRYLYEDDAVPPRAGSDAGVTRWLAIVALGLALLAGAFIWNGLSDDDDASGTPTDTAAQEATTADTAPDSTAAAPRPARPRRKPRSRAAPLRLLRSALVRPRRRRRRARRPGAARDRRPGRTPSGRASPTAAGRTSSSIKPGVGLIVELARPTEIDAVAVRSTRPGYTLSVYTSAEADSPTGLEDYTQVVTPREVLNPQVRLALRKPLKARYVLLWFTKLSPTAVNDRFGVEVNEVRVTGVPAGAAATTTGSDAEATGTDQTATGEDGATGTDGAEDTADGESTAP